MCALPFTCCMFHLLSCSSSKCLHSSVISWSLFSHSSAISHSHCLQSSIITSISMVSFEHLLKIWLRFTPNIRNFSGEHAPQTPLSNAVFCLQQILRPKKLLNLCSGATTGYVDSIIICMSCRAVDISGPVTLYEKALFIPLLPSLPASDPSLELSDPFLSPSQDYFPNSAHYSIPLFCRNYLFYIFHLLFLWMLPIFPTIKY